MKLPLTVLLLVSLLFVSCERNKVEEVQPSRNCRLVEQIMHPWSSTYGYTLKYTYTGDKISRIDDSRNEYFTFEYIGVRLTKKNSFYGGSASPHKYDIINYNADGTVSSIQRYWLKDLQANTYVQVMDIEFTYAGGKMVNVTTYRWGGGVRSKQQEYVYTYTGSNITKVDYTRHWDNGSGFTYTLTYNNLENYVRKRGTYAWLYTHVWDEYYGDLINGDAIARSQSAHNATIAFTGSTLYTADDDQNLSIIWRNNQTDEKYLYECR